jgi:hypothetical protein
MDRSTAERRVKMANQRSESTQQKRGNGEDFIPLPQTGGDASDVLDKAKDTANDLLYQAKSTAGEAYNKVSERTVSTIEEKKAGVAGGLKSVASSVRKMSDELSSADDQSPVTEYSARYVSTAAGKLERVADYFENKDLRTMAGDVENYARRNPAVFLGAAFAMGILAARFLKSSPTPDLTSQTFNADVGHQLPAETSGATPEAERRT